MSRSSCPSSTELRPARSTPTIVTLALALAAALAGCGDDGGATCGPGDAPADGLTITVDGEVVTYGGFTASINNDCTVAASGVISVSVHGTQIGGTGAFTLCLPRPDLLGADPVALSPSRLPPDPADRVQLVDASATLAGGCTLARDPAVAGAATATFAGYCAGGADPAGYAIGLAGPIGLRRTCPAGVTAVVGTAAGSFAVDVQ